MFILDKAVKAGAVEVRYDSAYEPYGSHTPVYKTVTLPEPSDYSDRTTYWRGVKFTISGGDERWYGAGAVTFGMGVVPGSALTWNRISDGTLVGSRNVGAYGLRARLERGSDEFDTLWGSRIVGSSKEDAFPDSTHCWYEWGQNDVNLGGGFYDVRVLRIGYNQDCLDRSEAKKYMALGSAADWGPKDVGVSDCLYTGSANNIYLGWISGGKPQLFHDNGSTFGETSVRLIAKPSNSVPTLTPVSQALGVLTEPRKLTVRYALDPSVSYSIDGKDPVPMDPAGGSVTLDLATIWSGLSLGSHTVVVAAEQDGYRTGATITFTKSTSTVSAEGKPRSSSARPSLCRLVDNCVVPSGAVITRSVTNNANDESPTWEPYTTSPHSFANATKTAATWGTAWKIEIDNSGGNNTARIQKGVAMSVLHERG